MLYASNTNETYGWRYDSAAVSVSNQQTLVSNMSGTDHSTRTLLLAQRAPGVLVVSFGSLSNLDLSATNVDSGTASVKAFNLTDFNSTYTYQTDGVLLGWGLRNEVGLAEHPITGGIWGVENSADQVTRYNVDVHATNPGEELNFLGYLNGTSSGNEGTNFGYPWCLSAWDTNQACEEAWFVSHPIPSTRVANSYPDVFLMVSHIIHFRVCQHLTRFRPIAAPATSSTTSTDNHFPMHTSRGFVKIWVLSPTSTASCCLCSQQEVLWPTYLMRWPSRKSHHVSGSHRC